MRVNTSPFSEIALVLVRPADVAGIIVNANDGIDVIMSRGMLHQLLRN
jgi:hypothetical protein